MTFKAFLEEGDNGRVYLRLAVPVHGGHVVVSPCWGGNRWAYWRRCGQMAYFDSLEHAVRAAMVDGAHDYVNEALSVTLTAQEVEKVTELLRWMLAG
jgi:hypothetical protein